MWLGPRPYRPYQYNIAPYYFRWWKDYSSQMGNWGVHYMDAIRWLLGERAPSSVSVHGGRYVLTDDRTIPDTMEVTFEFPSGAIAVFGIYEASGGPGVAHGEIELQGTKATLWASEDGYRITPARPGSSRGGSGWSSPPSRLDRRPATPTTPAIALEPIAKTLIRTSIGAAAASSNPPCIT